MRSRRRVVWIDGAAKLFAEIFISPSLHRISTSFTSGVLIEIYNLFLLIEVHRTAV